MLTRQDYRHRGVIRDTNERANPRILLSEGQLQVDGQRIIAWVRVIERTDGVSRAGRSGIAAPVWPELQQGFIYRNMPQIARVLGLATK